MHPLKAWRILPPAGAPLSLIGMVRALGARPKGGSLGELKRTLSRTFAMPHVFLCGSGREALANLFTVLRGLHPERDRVLLPAFGSYSLPSAVVRAGCRVGLYDLEPDTLLPRLDSLHRALDDRCLAVVACHQFGFAFDLAPMERMCRAAGVALIDDAAQALGASANGRPAGTMGDAGIFSLSRGKNITAVSGGICITRNEDLARGMAALAAQNSENASPTRRPQSLFGLFAKALALWALRHPILYRVPASLPWLQLGASIFDPHFTRAPFTPFQAGLTLHSLARLEALTAARAANAAAYQELLRNSAVARPILPRQNTVPAYLRFPLLPGEGAPEGWARRAANRSLGVSRGFPLALHYLEELIPHLDTDGAIYPGASFLARHLITLPTHDHVRPKDRRAIARHILTRTDQTEAPPASSSPRWSAKTKEGARP